MKKTLAIGFAFLLGLAAVGTVSANYYHRYQPANAIDAYQAYNTGSRTSVTYSSNYLDAYRKAARRRTNSVPNYVYPHKDGGYYLPFYESERIYPNRQTVTSRPTYIKPTNTISYARPVRAQVRQIPRAKIKNRAVYSYSYVTPKTTTVTRRVVTPQRRVVTPRRVINQTVNVNNANTECGYITGTNNASVQYANVGDTVKFYVKNLPTNYQINWKWNYDSRALECNETTDGKTLTCTVIKNIEADVWTQFYIPSENRYVKSNKVYVK